MARGTRPVRAIPKAQDVAGFSDDGSWIIVLARQNDGSWKWDWLVANSNLPLPGSTASGEDEQALYQIARGAAAAIVNKDMAVLDRILAAEFQANYAGIVGNKKQYLSLLTSNRYKAESLVNSEMRAFVLGDSAIVNRLSTEKSSTASKDSSGQYRWTDVFVKRDGRWQLVMGYATKAGSIVS